MRITKAEKWARFYTGMDRYGIGYEDANKLRRIEMTLHRWAELECGDGNEYASWAIERDEATEKPYMVRHVYGACRGGVNFPDRMIKTRIADREAGALRRLQRILSEYPELAYYHQTDPRGCALYIIPRNVIDDMVLDSLTLDQVYTRGFGVCVD